MSPLGRALLACALFSLVEYAYWAALLLLVFQEGGASLAGLVLLVQLVPAAVLATPLGVIGDRLPRGRALSLAYAVEALVLAGMALGLALDLDLPWVVALSTIATVTVSVARPIHNAALPQLSHTPAALVRANSVTGLLDGVGVFVGPIAAGLLAQSIGYAIVPALCAAAMLLAALLTVRLGLPAPQARDADGESSDVGWLAGVRAVRKDGAVFLLVLMAGISFIVIGSLEILGVAFATDQLDAGQGVQGVMIGAQGIGTFAGSIAAAGLALRAKLSPIVTASLVVAGLPLLLMTMTSALSPALLWLAICGFGLAMSSIAIRTLLQRSTDTRLLARVFAVHESLAMAGLAIGAVVAPLCVAWLGAAWAYVPVGLGLIATALVAMPVLRRLDLRFVFRPDVLSALRRVTFLQPLHPPPFERLSQTATWVEVPAGDTVIRQGDPGDAFYVIDHGRLSVTKDGQLLPYDMEAGESFGELALLRNAPRSATITAIEPSRLLRVDRDDFLAAVTGAADGREIARQVEEAFAARAADGARP